MAYKFQLGAAKLGGSIEAGAISGSALSSSAVEVDTADKVIAAVAAGDIPSSKMAIADTKILIGDAANGHAQEFALTGDVAMTAGGVVTIGVDKVDRSKMAHESRGDILVYGAGGAPAVLAKGTEHHVLRAGATDAAYGLLVDANIGSSAAIAITKLAEKQISGKDLGTNLDAVVDGNGIADFSFNGSAGATISIELESSLALALSSNGLDLKSTIAGNRTFSGDMVISGDLTVNGTNTVLDTTTLSVQDKDIVLGAGNSTSNVVDGTGIILEAGSGDDLEFLWNTDKMELKKGAAFADMKAGTFTGALVGNASTATVLASARTIGGVSFDGSALIVPQTIQILDEENMNAERLIMFADGNGSFQPKSDGDLAYNPSTGALSATTFIGSGASLTGLVSDSVVETVVAKTANYNLDETSETILLGNAASAAFAFTLPAASGKSGVMFKIKKIDTSAHAVQIKPASGEFLEFVQNAVLALETQGAAVSVFCDGAGWFVM